jgi:hypothetical protein
MSQVDSNAGAVGANIIAAAKVMRATHVATSTLLMLLDERFAKNGYVAAHATSQWVGMQMSGAQIGSGEKWMATLLHRGYLAEKEPANTAIIVTIDLAPERYPEPILSTLGLFFPTAVTAMEFWKSWDWLASRSWQGGRLGDVEVSPDALIALLRKRPVHASGHILGLCQLNRQNTEALVVKPALELIQQARAKM